MNRSKLPWLQRRLERLKGPFVMWKRLLPRQNRKIFNLP